MAWGCTCSGVISDFTPYVWPVAEAECSGKAQACQMMCNKDTIHPAPCNAACTSYYRCGTDKAPPSYLQTENSTDLPSYDGPKKEVHPNGTLSNSTANGTTPETHVTSLGTYYHLQSFFALIPIVSTMIIYL